MPIYRITRTGYDSMDGGTLRSRQLREILVGAGHEVLDLPAVDISGSMMQSLRATFSARQALGLRFMKALRHGGIKGLKQFLITCGRKWRLAMARMRAIPERSTILWEDTWNPVVAHAAKQCGHRLIAAPQNIEMLVPEQFESFYHFGQGIPLENEITAVRLADAVFTISREEQWLLRCFGIDSRFLPYYPPTGALDDLLAIREKREASSKQHILVMGSATNPPTKLGMIQIARWLYDAGVDAGDLVFAGHGTDLLVDQFPDVYRSRILGSVSAEKREELFLGAKAAIVHQINGTGALTRIGDMLTAGIPVCANDIAARSWHGTDGLRVYADAADLQTLLSASFPSVPIPIRPTSAEARFVSAIEKT